MRRSLILVITLSLLTLQTRAQGKDKLKLIINGEVITNLDSVRSGQSILTNINTAISFTESYISGKIGKDNFLNNYKFDSTFNEVFLIISEGSGVFSTHSRPIKSDNAYAGVIEEYDEKLRLIYHYNLAYKNIQDPTRGFGLYVQLTGDKSEINVQGLISLTKERNLTNILTREQILIKIKKSKFSKEVKRSLKNITINEVTYDFDQFKGEPFEKIYYTILLKDINEPAFYKFDPWTGELCCTVKTKIN